MIGTLDDLESKVFVKNEKDKTTSKVWLTPNFYAFKDEDALNKLVLHKKKLDNIGTYTHIYHPGNTGHTETWYADADNVYLQYYCVTPGSSNNKTEHNHTTGGSPMPIASSTQAGIVTAEGGAFFDLNTTGKVDTLDTLKEFLDGVEITKEFIPSRYRNVYASSVDLSSFHAEEYADVELSGPSIDDFIAEMEATDASLCYITITNLQGDILDENMCPVYISDDSPDIDTLEGTVFTINNIPFKAIVWRKLKSDPSSFDRIKLYTHSVDDMTPVPIEDCIIGFNGCDGEDKTVPLQKKINLLETQITALEARIAALEGN